MSSSAFHRQSKCKTSTQRAALTKAGQTSNGCLVSNWITSTDLINRGRAREKGARSSVSLFFLVSVMNIVRPSPSISSDRMEILSWQSFLPSTSRSVAQRPGLDSTSMTSIMSSSSSLSSQVFFTDPCLVTASNLALYINPQRRPDII